MNCATLTAVSTVPKMLTLSMNMDILKKALFTHGHHKK
jgi:hypothetical protein